MNTYHQYCPIAKATEVLAQPWTPLILRELLAGSCHFNDLERGLPGISRTLLSQRLRHLRRFGIIERHPIQSGRGTRYQLTRAGEELRGVIDAVGAWGARWVLDEPQPADLDPGLLLWRMRRRVFMDRIPRRRVVVEFDFRGERSGRFWLVLEPADVSVCLEHPGCDVDLVVDADTRAFHRVWLGRMSLGQAMHDDLVRIEGDPTLVRTFPSWFAWSPFADAVRKAGDERASA